MQRNKRQSNQQYYTQRKITNGKRNFYSPEGVTDWQFKK